MFANGILCSGTGYFFLLEKSFSFLPWGEKGCVFWGGNIGTSCSRGGKKVDKGGHCFVTHDPIYGRERTRGKEGKGVRSDTRLLHGQLRGRRRRGLGIIVVCVAPAETKAGQKRVG